MKHIFLIFCFAAASCWGAQVFTGETLDDVNVAWQDAQRAIRFVRGHAE